MMVATGTTSDNATHERSLVLTFDDFGRAALAALAQRDGVPIPEYVTACCLTYAERLENEAFSLRVPRFKPPDGEPYELRLALPAHVWQTLEGDAARQGIPIEQLIEHAAISGLARDPDRPDGAAADSATASLAQRLPGRRRVAAVVAVVVLGVPLLTAGLAIGGVMLPDAARAPFEAVGIELPNQSDDANAPERPAAPSGDSAPPSGSAGVDNGDDSHAARGQDRRKPDRGGDGGRGDGAAAGDGGVAAGEGDVPVPTGPVGSGQPGEVPNPAPGGVEGLQRTLEEEIRGLLDRVQGPRGTLPVPEQ